MKFLFIFILAGIGMALPKWEPNFETAKNEAREKGKLILVNFSGSDWCGPCIRLHKEVFNSAEFSKLAENSLVLYNADFPRSKKNQLTKELQHINETLADQYDPQGKFPYTVLLSAEGKVIKAWDGYPQNNRELFIQQLNSYCNAGQ